MTPDRVSSPFHPLRIALLIATPSDPGFLRPLVEAWGRRPDRYRTLLVSAYPRAALPPPYRDGEVHVPAWIAPSPLRRRLRALLAGARGLLPGGAPALPGEIFGAPPDLPEELRVWYDRTGRDLVGRLDALEARSEPFFRAFRPAIVVSIADFSPPMDAVIWGARARGIPTLNIQHGPFFCDGIDLLAMPGKWREVFPFDHFAYWGDHARRLFTGAGYPPGRMWGVGSLLFDGAPAARTEEARLEARRFYGLPAVARVALIVHQPFLRYLPVTGVLFDAADDVRSWYRMLLDGLTASPGWHALLKPHPTTGPTEPDLLLLDDLAAALPPARVRRAGATDEVWRAVAAADVVITYNSTLGFQGLAAGRPLVVARPRTAHKDDPFTTSGAAHVAGEAADIIRLLRQAAAGSLPVPPAASILLEDQVGPLDGGAAERLRLVIDRIVAEEAG
jgi:hypothetical protein